MKKTEVKMNKPVPVYLGQAISDISKTLTLEFWYDQVKPKYKDKAKLCYMDTDSFIIYVKTVNFSEDIANDAAKWFDTSNYDENDKRPLPIGINKKLLGMFKDELGGKIMTEFVALRAKTYANLMEDGSEHKKAKGTNKCVIKRELMFEHYKDCLFNDKVILKSQQKFRSDYHRAYTEEVNKIALSSNDDKRLQSFNKIITHPYGSNAFMVCEKEMLVRKKNKF